ncbi:hypothetical protein DFH07DRAFT_134588 [Mycena maculata]|uniref:Uncharacterized protein n=1 Tax=Mycena maculata TaxID=230809 RepID=A0AAD7I4C8_9AGAR|nr:hypothetical protein DFH07DRAFT_134588 [Mycena maculata]
MRSQLDPPRSQRGRLGLCYLWLDANFHSPSLAHGLAFHSSNNLGRSGLSAVYPTVLRSHVRSFPWFGTDARRGHRNVTSDADVAPGSNALPHERRLCLEHRRWRRHQACRTRAKLDFAEFCLKMKSGWRAQRLRMVVVAPAMRYPLHQIQAIEQSSGIWARDGWIYMSIHPRRPVKQSCPQTRCWEVVSSMYSGTRNSLAIGQ